MLTEKEKPASRPALHAAEDQPGEDQAAAVLRRIEQLLSEMRGTLDAATRETQHRDFSVSLLVGSILQVVVVGLAALAVLDVIFQRSTDAILVKLAFAGVLQLGTLAAFLIPRLRR